MKSSIRFVSRLMVFALATTLVPVHVLAMEAQPQNARRILDCIQANVLKYTNIDQELLGLFNQYQDDRQIINAMLPMAKLPVIGEHVNVSKLEEKLALDDANLAVEINIMLGRINENLTFPKNLIAGPLLKKYLRDGLPTEAALKAQAEAEALAQEKTEREAAEQRAQAALEREQEAARLAAERAEQERIAEEKRMQEAAKSAADNERTAMIAAQAKERLAQMKRQEDEMRERMAALQAQAEERRRLAAAEPVADLQVKQEESGEESEDFDTLIAAAAREQELAQQAAELQAQREEAERAAREAELENQRVQEAQRMQQAQQAAERLAAAEERARDAEARIAAAEARATAEAERARLATEQATHARERVAQAAAATPPADQSPFSLAGLTGFLGNLWNNLKTKIQENPKTSAVAGLGIAYGLYKLISSFMAGGEDDADESDAGEDMPDRDHAEEETPARQTAAPAEQAVTVSPKDAEASRLQNLKRKRAQMRRQFFKNRGRCCTSRCKRSCR